MMNAGERLLAYPFTGVLEGCRTIESLWEANGFRVNPKVELDLSDPNWKIYTQPGDAAALCRAGIPGAKIRWLSADAIFGN